MDGDPQKPAVVGDIAGVGQDDFLLVYFPHVKVLQTNHLVSLQSVAFKIHPQKLKCIKSSEQKRGQFSTDMFALVAMRLQSKVSCTLKWMTEGLQMNEDFFDFFP